MAELRHGRAKVNGIELHYAATGSGKLMLFVHGFPEFWYAWRGMLDRFGRDHLAVAYDTRGINLSDRPPAVSDYEPKNLVADIAGMIRHFGQEKCILVGHDWGGVGCWAFAIAHPEMVEKLVIINSPHPGVFARLIREDAAQQKASAYMLMFRGEDAEEKLLADRCAALRGRITGPLREKGVMTAADEDAYVEAWTRPGALTAGLNYYRAMKIKPPQEAGRRGEAPAPSAASVSVRVPTLVVWGMKDTALLPGNLDGLEAFVPDLTVRRVPEGTHWVIHEYPDEVAGHIRDFLAR